MPRTPFDPTAPSCVEPKQKKRNDAISGTPRSRSVTVIMLKQYISFVPKGKYRQELASNGKIINLVGKCSIMRLAIITDAFKVHDFIQLECVGGGNNTLIKSNDQSMRADTVMNRKGALYLCENYDVS